MIKGNYIVIAVEVLPVVGTLYLFQDRRHSHCLPTYQGVRTLCKEYFECRRAVDGSWFTELMTCDEGQMFSYDEHICVSKPSGVYAFIMFPR